MQSVISQILPTARGVFALLPGGPQDVERSHLVSWAPSFRSATFFTVSGHTRLN